MHVVVVGPRLLPTDGMIFEGSRNLFDIAGLPIHEYQLYTDSVDREITCYREPTHIVVLGTPWVWDKCYDSLKYKGLIGLLRQYPNAKKLFFGVGSCLPLGKNDLIVPDLKDNIHKLARLFDNSTLIVRDCLAKEILAPFNPILMPCPAYYSIASYYNSTHGPDTMIWYDPTIGISSVDFGPDSDKLEQYIDTFQNAYKEKRPAVYCIDPLEIPFALRIGLPEPTIIKGTGEAKVILSNARSIISGRVHLSVPAYTLGKQVHLVPVDSRAATLYDVATGKIRHPSEAIDDYLDILKSFQSP